MDAKVHADLRVMELTTGGVMVIPAEGLTHVGKEYTDPLGLTLWASKVEGDHGRL